MTPRMRALWGPVSNRPLTSWSTLIVVVWLTLVATGTTTSSLGVSPLRDDPNQAVSGLIVGAPRTIRSDEFLRTTPWSIGMLTSHGGDFFSAMTYPDTALVAPGAGGVTGRIMFPEAGLTALAGPVIPEQAFSFGWWFSAMLTALLGPLWLRQLGVAPQIGIPTTLLVLLAPPTAWWSLGPLTVLGAALAAATCAFAAVSRFDTGAPRRAILLTALAAVAFARLALTYQPWSIPVALALLGPTLAAILYQSAQKRRALLVVGAVVVVGGALVLAFFHEHAAAMKVLTETVYPGSRRSTGAMSNLAALFGAPHDWVLQTNPALVGTNQSELSAGYLVLGLAAAVLVPAVDWARAGILRPVTIASFATLAALAAWCTIEWPSGGSHLFPLSLVTPKRLVQILGYLGTITFAFTFAAYARASTGSRTAMINVTGLAAFFVTAMAGSTFRQVHLPDYRTPWIGIVAVATAVVIVVAVRWAQARWALVPMVALAIPVVAAVSPFQQGFGDLHEGAAAQQVRTLGKTLRSGERWGSDDIYFDAVLMANAQPSVSGQQWLGPRESTWRIIDPTGRHRDMWNRGAAFLTLTWTNDDQDTIIESPQLDFMNLKLDPCGEAARRLHVRLVSSGRPLARRCLVERGTTSFGGLPRWLYEVTVPQPTSSPPPSSG